MYYVSKKFEVAASHHLTVAYQSKCTRPHGHNWNVEVFCRAEELNGDGMVTDFSVIKTSIMDVIDHKDLNEVLPFNPTSENLARWICERIPNCYKVIVSETSNNTATYEK